MKTAEDLEKQYQDFQMSENRITSYEDFNSYIHRVIEDVEKACDTTMRQIEESRNWKKPGRLKSLLPKGFVKEASEFYDYDVSILLGVSELLINNLEYLVKIRNAANKDNFQELNKLTNFLLVNYQSNISYLNAQKDVYIGSTLFDLEHENNMAIVEEFAEKHLAPYEVKEEHKKLIKK